MKNDENKPNDLRSELEKLRGALTWRPWVGEKYPAEGGLLVIGESFDNALLKLLASEYENLYSIDLRNYETDLGHPFDLASYTAEHDIDSVLLIGNLDYWKLEEFLPGGGAA